MRHAWEPLITSETKTHLKNVLGLARTGTDALLLVTSLAQRLAGDRNLTSNFQTALWATTPCTTLCDWCRAYNSLTNAKIG